MKLDKRIGNCHICGKRCKLSFEHIPPKATFNSEPANLISIETYLGEDNKVNLPWETKGLRYKQFQGGKGFYSLCSECNNLTGEWYGKYYADFIMSIHNGLRKQNTQNVVGAKITLNLNPIAVLKQIISMFCSLNPDSIGEEFRDFLLDVNNHEFDKNKYKVCVYLQKGPLERYCPISSTVNLVNHHATTVSEISTYPLGFTLYFLEGKEDAFYGCDITCFADYNYNESAILELTLPLYEINTAFPIDYRSKSEIIKTRIKNQKFGIR